ncbi:hypothetical protein OC25_02340 [Pedobacter kyungheensis]|uniref:Uncharacterized protein n=1 Tax=Pedobacter kyungheensis TaxID=1069985 RepID=A0A0C1DRC0_9SPHI|nr:hypothetical protein OC25_02340 [Pedobacter kyungheensis]
MICFENSNFNFLQDTPIERGLASIIHMMIFFMGAFLMDHKDNRCLPVSAISCINKLLSFWPLRESSPRPVYLSGMIIFRRDVTWEAVPEFNFFGLV